MLKDSGKEVFYNHNDYIWNPAELKENDVNPWGSDIMNRSINGYLKVGVPLNEDNSQNIALIADYNYQDMDSYFGATKYIAGQHSAFANLLYQNVINDSHRFTLGMNGVFDRYDEEFRRIVFMQDVKGNGVTDLASAGIFGEYTYHYGETVSVIAGMRGDWFNHVSDGKSKFRVSPRLTLKYMPIDEIVIRANGGRGLRYSTPLVDNIGAFSTGKRFEGAYNDHILEDAWTFGGNITYYLPFGASSNTYLSVDYFRTQFAQQMVVDYEQDPTMIDFYALNGKRSYTDNIQLDFSVGKGLVEKPMTSRFKGVLNLQYATNLNKWIFDFTASLNGSCRVYDFMKNINEDGSMTSAPKDGVARMYKNGRTPVYPMLYAQVTRRFKGWDVYVGAENLTNFRQKNAIIGAANPRQPIFDASCIWGPLMGIKAHVGFRFTLWKKA